MGFKLKSANEAITEALGLNPHQVDSIHLVLEARQPPKVIVSYLPSPANLAALGEVLVQYQLVERP